MLSCSEGAPVPALADATVPVFVIRMRDAGSKDASKEAAAPEADQGGDVAGDVIGGVKPVAR